MSLPPYRRLSLLFSTARANLSTLCMYPGQPTPRSRLIGPTFLFLLLPLSCLVVCSFASLSFPFSSSFDSSGTGTRVDGEKHQKLPYFVHHLCPPFFICAIHPSMNVLYGEAISGGVMAALTLLRAVADLGRGWNFAGLIETRGEKGSDFRAGEQTVKGSSERTTRERSGGLDWTRGV